MAAIIGRLRIGCCIGNVEQIGTLEAAGAGYCEVSVTHLVMGTEAQFESLLERLAASPVPARAASVLLPAGLPVVGPAVDRRRFENHLQIAMSRLQRLGVEVLVFGSGAARSVPAGFDRQAALNQFETALRLAAETGARHGVAVALEPLRAAETNLLNSVSETAAFLHERDCGPARLVADLYHMREEGEPSSVLQDCADLLVHAHVAGPERRPPRPQDTDVGEFLAMLRAAGYAGGISLECRWEDFASEVPPAVRWLRAEVVRPGFGGARGRPGRARAQGHD